MIPAPERAVGLGPDRLHPMRARIGGDEIDVAGFPRTKLIRPRTQPGPAVRTEPIQDVVPPKCRAVTVDSGRHRHFVDGAHAGFLGDKGAAKEPSYEGDQKLSISHVFVT